MNSFSPPVLVVVSHYNARPCLDLVGLLDSMSALPAGCAFRVRVVVNLAAPQRLLLSRRHRDVEVCYRDNTGYNIGAWEHGWRVPPPYESYLFLQEECRVARAGWVEAFVRRAAQAEIGLVGECLSPLWDASWEDLALRFRGERLAEHLVAGAAADRVDCYLDFFRRQGIPPGRKGDHLQSLVLFARRAVLQAIGGFPVGANYGEAIAAEIAISKKVQERELAICEVGPTPFSYIEHPQWLHRRQVGLP